jgi:FkbM family methyltransferase
MDSKFVKSARIWVFGSGNFAKEVVFHLSDLNIATVGILDNLRIGELFETDSEVYTVLKPSSDFLKPGDIVVIAVCNLHGNLHAIASNLQEIQNGLQIISPVELFRFFSKHGLEWENYWLSTDFEVYERCAHAIEEFREILSDEESIILYDAILRYRKSGSIPDLPVPYPLAQQYLADELNTPPLKLNIIDLGACRGENLEDFLRSGRNFHDGYLLEPDSQNFEVLKSKVLELKLGSLKCSKLGAWDHCTLLKFEETGNPAASFSDQGSVEIEVVALDDFIPNDFHANFVKMDIEGAEMKALKGMRGLIDRDAPHLAISAYHNPTDLWEVGLYLNANHPNIYKFHLRMYGHQTFDTILYAVPMGH